MDTNPLKLKKMQANNANQKINFAKVQLDIGDQFKNIKDIQKKFDNQQPILLQTSNKNPVYLKKLHRIQPLDVLSPHKFSIIFTDNVKQTMKNLDQKMICIKDSSKAHTYNLMKIFVMQNAGQEPKP